MRVEIISSALLSIDVTGSSIITILFLISPVGSDEPFTEK